MTRQRASRTLENELRREGFVFVAGVDEVGRGCLAGPVVAAAVIPHEDRSVTGVADSTAVPGEEREALYPQIIDAAVSWAAAVVEPDEIDRINIHKASFEAMRRAIFSLQPLPGF